MSLKLLLRRRALLRLIGFYNICLGLSLRIKVNTTPAFCWFRDYTIFKSHFIIKFQFNYWQNNNGMYHYENKPIQVYWKFYHQKMKISDKNSDIFHISAQNIDCGYSLEPPRRGGSNEYPQSMFLSKNKKNNVYPCKPQFYYIQVGFKGVNILKACFCDANYKVKHQLLPPHSLIRPFSVVYRCIYNKIVPTEQTYSNIAQFGWLRANLKRRIHFPLAIEQEYWNYILCASFWNKLFNAQHSG